MSEIRIVGLDLDGTVFDDKKQISPRTIDAISQACARGVLVLPATGRPLCGVPKQFLQIPGVRYALTSNGATVTELATGHRLVEQTFPPEQARRLFAALRGYDCTLDLFVDGESYTTRASMEKLERYASPEILPYLRSSRHVVEDMSALLDAHPHGVEKFSILYADLAERAAARQMVCAAFDAEVTSSFANNLEINAHGVDKGTALLALAVRLGLGAQNVMACGDSSNDLAMLQKAGLGVAMGNAEPKIRGTADFVTSDNNHDGVAEAIERFVLRPQRDTGGFHG